MSNGIYLMGRGRVNEGRIEAAKAALGSVIQDVKKNNPGVEVYEHAVDSMTGVWIGIEKYADNEALKMHLTNPAVGAALGTFMSDLTFEGIVVIGDVSQEIKEMMAGFNPTYLGASLGFARRRDPRAGEQNRQPA